MPLCGHWFVLRHQAGESPGGLAVLERTGGAKAGGCAIFVVEDRKQAGGIAEMVFDHQGGDFPAAGRFGDRGSASVAMRKRVAAHPAANSQVALEHVQTLKEGSWTWSSGAASASARIAAASGLGRCLTPIDDSKPTAVAGAMALATRTACAVCAALQFMSRSLTGFHRQPVATFHKFHQKPRPSRRQHQRTGGT